MDPGLLEELELFQEALPSLVPAELEWIGVSRGQPFTWAETEGRAFEVGTAMPGLNGRFLALRLLEPYPVAAYWAAMENDFQLFTSFAVEPHIRVILPQDCVDPFRVGILSMRRAAGGARKLQDGCCANEEKEREEGRLALRYALGFMCYKYSIWLITRMGDFSSPREKLAIEAMIRHLREGAEFAEENAQQAVALRK